MHSAEFFDNILKIVSASSSTVREWKSLADQFAYRYNYSQEVGVLAAIVEFNPQIIFVLIAISTRAVETFSQIGKLEEVKNPGENLTVVHIRHC